MLEKWFKSIVEHAANAEASGDEFGACFLPNPNGGPPFCVQLDKNTCKNLNGKFLGGDCVTNIVETNAIATNDRD